MKEYQEVKEEIKEENYFIDYEVWLKDKIKDSDSSSTPA